MPDDLTLAAALDRLAAEIVEMAPDATELVTQLRGLAAAYRHPTDGRAAIVRAIVR